jgi:hypothetical protein
LKSVKFKISIIENIENIKNKYFSKEQINNKEVKKLLNNKN